MPIDRDPSETTDRTGSDAETSRRAFLLMGLGGMALLAGCGSTTQTVRVPRPAWRGEPAPPPVIAAEPVQVPAQSAYGPPGMVMRTSWTSAKPNYASMNAMLPVHSITVHHDGMRPFFDTSDGATRDRLEQIRRGHRNDRGWGDIGYHYAVDRTGRIWECRPITHQGAHVANHNEGNIGVLALGNFDQQAPTSAQLEALNRQLSWLMREYRVPMARVRTHREWDGAKTACPGTALQAHMNRVRSGRMLG